MKKIIWFDLTNTPHNNFLFPIYENYKESFDFIFSMREFSETEYIFNTKFGKPYKIVSSHKGKNKIRKVLGLVERTIKLFFLIDKFDIKISVGGDASNYVAKFRKKISITFDDNEMAPNWRYSPFSDFAFWPKAVDEEVLLNQKFKSEKLYRYNGYKEDIYLADFMPNKNFLNEIPFDKFIIVRPENVQANYIRNGNVKSIVPSLLKKLLAEGYNIVYLPRYEIDRSYANNLKNIYIPDNPIDGLNACYYADVVLTGAGTLAREAACLGVPAVSFYAGRELLAVDKQMIKDGWTFFSRDVESIIGHMKTVKRRERSLERSKKVKKEVMEKLTEVIDSFI